MRLRAEVIRRALRRLAAPGSRARRASLAAAVAWLIGVSVYFYVDLLIQRSDTIRSTFSNFTDVFG